MQQTRDALLRSLAHLQAQEKQGQEKRAELLDLAGRQRDSAHRAARVAAEHMDRGSEAGALGARYVYARQHEARRLDALLVEHAPPDDQDPDGGN